MKTRQSTKSGAAGESSSSSFNKKTPANDLLRKRSGHNKPYGEIKRMKMSPSSPNKKSIVLQNKSPQIPDNNNGNNNNDNNIVVPKGNNNNNNLPPRQRRQVINISPFNDGTPIQLVPITTEKPKTPSRRSIRKASTSTPKTNPKQLSTPTTKSTNKTKSSVRRSLAFSDKDEQEEEDEEGNEGDVSFNNVENINLMKMHNEASPNPKAGKNRNSRFLQVQDDSNSDDGSPKFHLKYDKNIA